MVEGREAMEMEGERVSWVRVGYYIAGREEATLRRIWPSSINQAERKRERWRNGEKKGGDVERKRERGGSSD